MKELMKCFSRWSLLIALLMGSMCYLQDKACAEAATSEVQTILAKHTTPYTKPLSTVGAREVVNSMLLQSHDKTIRVFPVWQKAKPAAFKDLRAFGAFLVSSKCQNGQVSYVAIKSEADRLCRIENPWHGKACEVLAITSGSPEKVNFHVEGNIIHFPTEEGKQYLLRPL